MKTGARHGLGGCSHSRMMWGCFSFIRFRISRRTFSPMPPLWILFLFRIFTATFCPVFSWMATAVGSGEGGGGFSLLAAEQRNASATHA